MAHLHSLLIGLGCVAMLGNVAQALPPPDDVPEEVLRTELITEARSPLDGEPIDPVNYATLQDQLRDPNIETVVNTEIAQLIQLLEFRRVLKPILPFLP
ncbi:hypothetical protein IQ254_21975 [Nodosilinea sp. LEGE 07088]|uniref:hypothetical protein n=1 Tax=Nodosilinea sp. LEGE 07088 TaxID=2777968 RepID=UPI00187FA31E|nr:hypothetical protein [Nodosilinea sp. LEGE 07088]MBE9139830.1 hypothetical protein [Nodosilinea sp. LEGE 07088]